MKIYTKHRTEKQFNQYDLDNLTITEIYFQGDVWEFRIKKCDSFQDVTWELNYDLKETIEGCYSVRCGKTHFIEAYKEFNEQFQKLNIETNGNK